MQPGSLYLFALPADDVGAEWLCVREHPDGGPLLLVPCDTAFWCGACDVPLPSVYGPRHATLNARCGCSVWCDPADLARRNPVPGGAVTAEELAEVRRVLADLARGRPMPAYNHDNDPEYWNHCGTLERLGLHLSGGRIE